MANSAPQYWPSRRQQQTSWPSFEHSQADWTSESESVWAVAERQSLDQAWRWANAGGDWGNFSQGHGEGVSRASADESSWWPENGGDRPQNNPARPRRRSFSVGRVQFNNPYYGHDDWSQPDSGGEYHVDSPCGYSQDWTAADSAHSGYGPWRRSSWGQRPRNQPYFQQQWQEEGQSVYRGGSWRRRSYRHRRLRSLPPGYGRRTLRSISPEVVDLMFRDITPEDYETLLRLDESVKRPTVPVADLEDLPVVDAKTAQSSDQECGVCLSKFEDDDCVTSLPCRHLFHRGCIVKWLAECRRSCPLCGEEVSNAGASCPERTS